MENRSTNVEPTTTAQTDANTALVAVRKRGGDNGKRNPVIDDMGYKWCNCTKPRLTHNGGGRGQALCLKCGEAWYH